MLLEVWERELYNTNEFTLPSFWSPRWSEKLNTHPLFIYKIFIKEYDTFSKTIQGLNIIWTLKVGVWCLDKIILICTKIPLMVHLFVSFLGN